LETHAHLAFDAADRLLKHFGEVRIRFFDADMVLKFSVVVEHGTKKFS
jgi:hypothetical protein